MSLDSPVLFTVAFLSIATLGFGVSSLGFTIAGNRRLAGFAAFMCGACLFSILVYLALAFFILAFSPAAS